MTNAMEFNKARMRMGSEARDRPHCKGEAWVNIEGNEREPRGYWGKCASWEVAEFYALVQKKVEIEPGEIQE